MKDQLLATCSRHAGYAETSTLGQFLVTETENLQCRVVSCKEFTPRSMPSSRVNRVTDADDMFGQVLALDLSTNSGVYSVEAQTKERRRLVRIPTCTSLTEFARLVPPASEHDDTCEDVKDMDDRPRRSEQHMHQTHAQRGAKYRLSRPCALRYPRSPPRKT